MLETDIDIHGFMQITAMFLLYNVEDNGAVQCWHIHLSSPKMDLFHIDLSTQHTPQLYASPYGDPEISCCSQLGR